MMRQKLFDQSEFHRLAERGEASGGVIRASVGQPEIVSESQHLVRFCFSDSSVDRMGDSIDAAGWNLTSFLKNPVALFGHDSSAPPIGRARDVRVENDRLMGTIEFMSADLYPFADEIFRMVREKYLRAVSVGFLPLEWRWADGADRRGGIDFEKQELLEISVVPIPANANALVQASGRGLRRFSPRRPAASTPAAAVKAPEPPPRILGFPGTAQMRQRQFREATSALRHEQQRAQAAVARQKYDGTRDGARLLAARLHAIYRAE
jgi:HK97 family phage prohead protease